MVPKCICVFALRLVVWDSAFFLRRHEMRMVGWAAILDICASIQRDKLVYGDDIM